MKLYVEMKIFLFLHTEFGEVAEWSNALVLKTSVQQCTGGSNPSLSAKKVLAFMLGLFINNDDFIL